MHKLRPVFPSDAFPSFIHVFPYFRHPKTPEEVYRRGESAIGCGERQHSDTIQMNELQGEKMQNERNKAEMTET